MKISIALCTYNGQRFLSEQLASLLAQTRRPDEIVVCDDGSTDDTIRLLEEFAASAPFPVSVNRNADNLGVVKNFEKAISLCGGDIIFLCDQDDVWQESKIARFEREFASRPEVGMVFSDAELVGEHLEPLGETLWSFYFPARHRIRPGTADFFEAALRRNIVTGATMAFRADLRGKFMPIPEDLPMTIHDGWITLVAAAVGEVSFIEERLVGYRQHGGQQIGVTAWKEGRSADYDAAVAMHELNLARLEKLAGLIDSSEIFARRRDSRPEIGRIAAEEHEAIAHCRFRGSLAPARARRAGDVVRELLSGRYHRFSKGLRSAAKDLFS